ncbi:hypothetical protein AB1L07_25205 [Niallia alba]|uniref:hypothetical protein n=1 Tax=Niallia alba TaxID=2729105 RepID=UPI0039A19811
MDINKDIRNVISNIILTLDAYEEDKEKYPLFHWEYNDRYIAKVTNENIRKFFLILLRSESITNNSENIDEEDYEEFLENFFSDVVMSTLNDSIVNLVEFFRAERVRNKHPKIVDELFYRYDSFEKNMKEYIKDYDISDKENLLDFIGSYRVDIQYKVPKIIFPYYAYALTYTYKYMSSDLNIIQNRHLPLFWTNGKLTKDKELFVRSQKDFKTFINSLRENSTRNSHDFNKSLNLYLFNQTTNLYDVFNVVQLFKNNSIYMKREKIKDEIRDKKDIGKSFINEMKRSLRYTEKKEVFDSYSKIALLNNIGVKTFIVDNFHDENLFEISEIWYLINRLLNYCKSSLVKLIEEQSKSIFQNIVESIPDNIRVEYLVFRIFSQVEPFKYLIKEALDEGEPPIYTPIDNDIEMHLFEAYAHAYKAFYTSKSKYNNK